ncbi:hypothetical protein GCM10009642_18410 [Nocardiopsis metallicus]
MLRGTPEDNPVNLRSPNDEQGYWTVFQHLGADTAQDELGQTYASATCKYCHRTRTLLKQLDKALSWVLTVHDHVSGSQAAFLQTLRCG